MSIEPASIGDSETLALARRSGWPDDLRVLLARYPREQWQSHANLGEMARFWLSRHDMFRELTAMIREIETQFRDGAAAAGGNSRNCSCRGCNFCCRSSASTIRSRTIITSRSSAPPMRAWRAASTCWKATTTPSMPTWRPPPRPPMRCLRALTGEAETLRRRGDDYAAASGALLKGLIRHLDDEEDLIVPLILERGEAALGVAHHG